MTRVTDILTRSRDILEDTTTPYRWSDARLIRLIDEAQRIFTLESKIYVRKQGFLFIGDQAEYTLPDDCIVVLRVTSKGQILPQITHESLDKINVLWESQTSEIAENIIFDKTNSNSYRIYPTPTASTVTSSYTLASAENPLLGLIVSGPYPEYDVADTFGIMVGMTDPNSSDVVSTVRVDGYDSDFGFPIMFEDNPTDIIIYYIANPADIVDSNSLLSINKIWDIALKHYVVGIAFRDDKDTQNKEVGNEQLSLFYKEIDRAKQYNSDNHSSTSRHSVSYNNGFNLG